MSYHYEILEHRADIRLKITASTIKELFQGALEGMAYIIKLEETSRGPIEEKIEVSSLDINALLVDFLNQVLALSDIYNAVFDKVEIEKLTGKEIRGKIKGQKVDKFKEEIKAVTYTNLEIKKKESKELEAEILFDI